GSRTSRLLYKPKTPPDLELVARDGSGVIRRWSQSLERAKTAHAEIKPGLVGSQIPGGAAYAGVPGRNLVAVTAANRAVDGAAVSLGTAGTLGERIAELEQRHGLVVSGLPKGGEGDAVLDQLLRDQRPGDLLIVMQAPPRKGASQLLPAGASGLSGG